MHSIYGSHKLIIKKYRQLTLQNQFGALAKALIFCVDSLVAGYFLSMTALEVMALSVPFLMIDEVLHGLLGQGTMIQISQAAGRGDRKSMNRIIGAVIPAVLIVYIIVLLPVIIFSDTILGLLSDDPVLISKTVSYIVPMMLSMPFFEACLCLERAYQIDGRVKLFVTRPIITGCLNIVLDIIFVVILHKEISGIVAATIISTALGYCITLSHGFSSACTVKPDFSVLRNHRECRKYLRYNLSAGGSYAIESGTDCFISALVCRLLSASGGSGILAIWSIFTQFTNIVYACAIGQGNGLKLMGGFLFGVEDQSGIEAIEKLGLKLSLCLGLGITIPIILFMPLIARSYGIEPGMLSYCVLVLRSISPVFIALTLLCNFKTYFTVISRYKISYTILIFEKLSAVLFAIFGAQFGTSGVFMGYSLSSFVVLAGFVLIMVLTKTQFFFSGNDCGSVYYSIVLDKEQIALVSRDLRLSATEKGCSAETSERLFMLMEDLLNITCIRNEKPGIEADIRVDIKEDKIILTITDNGIPYNLSEDFGSYTDPEKQEERILCSGAGLVSYDRFMELNYFVLKSTAAEET